MQSLPCIKSTEFVRKIKVKIKCGGSFAGGGCRQLPHVSSPPHPQKSGTVDTKNDPQTTVACPAASQLKKSQLLGYTTLWPGLCLPWIQAILRGLFLVLNPVNLCTKILLYDSDTYSWKYLAF